MTTFSFNLVSNANIIDLVKGPMKSVFIKLYLLVLLY